MFPHCEENRFDFKNIQPNQITCFEYNLQCGNTRTGFAIYFERMHKWLFLPYVFLKNLMDSGKKSVNWVSLDEIDEVLI